MVGRMQTAPRFTRSGWRRTASLCRSASSATGTTTRAARWESRAPSRAVTRSLPSPVLRATAARALHVRKRARTGLTRRTAARATRYPSRRPRAWWHTRAAMRRRSCGSGALRSRSRTAAPDRSPSGPTPGPSPLPPGMRAHSVAPTRIATARPRPSGPAARRSAATAVTTRRPTTTRAGLASRRRRPCARTVIPRRPGPPTSTVSSK
jgi:hypothetical protein